MVGPLLLFCLSLAGAGELSGRRAPGFSLPDPGLKQHDLYDFRGKLVVLDFMKTDCPHCQSFSRVLEEVKGKYGERVAILSVVMPPDNLQTVQQYVRTHFITTPVLFDCGQVTASYLKITPQNPTVSLPHAFLIDAQGMIRKDFAYNESTKSIFEGKAIFSEIDRLLSGGKR